MKWRRGVLLLILFGIALPFASALLNCTITPFCTASSTVLEFAEVSDATNTHADNDSNIHANKICCRSSAATLQKTFACPAPRAASVLKVFDIVNSHAELPSGIVYGYTVCFHSDTAFYRCNVRTTPCSGKETCVASLYQATNTHIAACSQRGSYVQNWTNTTHIYQGVSTNKDVLHGRPYDFYAFTSYAKDHSAVQVDIYNKFFNLERAFSVDSTGGTVASTFSFGYDLGYSGILLLHNGTGEQESHIVVYNTAGTVTGRYRLGDYRSGGMITLGNASSSNNYGVFFNSTSSTVARFSTTGVIGASFTFPQSYTPPKIAGNSSVANVGMFVSATEDPVGDGKYDGRMYAFHTVGAGTPLTHLWNASLDLGGKEQFFGVAYDNTTEKLYAFGSQEDDGDGLVAQFHPHTGEENWHALFDHPDGDTVRFLAGAADSKGNLYVAGNKSSGGGILAYYLNNGTLDWYLDLGSEYQGIGPSLLLEGYTALTISEATSFVAKKTIGYGSYQLCCTDDDHDSDAWSDINQGGTRQDCDDTDRWNFPPGINYTCSDCQSSTLVYTANSTADSSSIYSTPCLFNSSAMVNSLINSSVVWSSNITNVITTDSHIEDSTLTFANVSFSTIEDSVIPCPYFVIQGKIIDNYLTSGRIIYRGITYSAPFAISDICAQMLPLTGTFNLSPNHVSNGSLLGLYFESDGNIALNISFAGSQIGKTETVSLLDSGMYPDMAAGDGIYSSQIFVNKTTDEEILLNLSVQDVAAGNTLIFNATLVIDNTPPNASILINEGANSTPEQTVLLSLSYLDENEILGCRYSDYNLSAILAHCNFENGFDCDASDKGLYTGNVTFGTGGFISSGISVYGGIPTNATLPSNDVLSLDAGTLSLWLKPSWSGSTNNNYVIFSNPNAYTSLDNFSDGFILYRNSTRQLIFAIAGTTITLLEANVSEWNPQSWHQVVVSWNNVSDGSHQAYLYVDGVLADSDTSIATFPTSQEPIFYLGSVREEYQFNGTMDELLITDYQKDAAQVAFEYSSPGHYVPQPCVATKPWTVSPENGEKIVYYEVIDKAGNARVVFDIIELILGDTTPPLNLSVWDEGDYTSSNSTLYASWSAFDAESSVLFSYRVYDTSTSTYLTNWTSADDGGTKTSAYITNLNLIHGHNYSIEVEAINEANRTVTAQSDGIYVDLVVPNLVTMTSSSHPNATWRGHGNINITFNGTDNFSGVGGYSYILDQQTSPDIVTDALASNFTAWNLTGVGTIYDIDMDGTGNVYVATSAGVRKYTASGVPKNILPSVGVVTMSASGMTAVVGNTTGHEVQFSTYLPSASAVASERHNISSVLTTINETIETTSGDYLIVGNYRPYASTSYPFILRLAHDGQLESFTPFTYNGTYFSGIGLDYLGNVYIAGADGQSRAIVYKYDGAWNLLVNNTLGGSSGFTSIVIDSLGNSYVAGYSTDADKDGVLLSYMPNGTLRFNVTYAGPGTTEEFRDLAMDSLRHSYVYMSSGATMTIRKYSSEGTLVASFSNVGITTLSSGFITTDSFDNVFTASTQLSPQIMLFDYDLQHSKAASFTTVRYLSIPNGKYQINTRARDMAFNWGYVAYYHVWIDRTQPSVPEFSNGTQAYSASISAAVEWGSSVDEESGVASYHIRYDNNSDFSSVDGYVVAGNVTDYTLTFPNAGVWYVQVRAENGAGLNSSWSGTTAQKVDTIVPTITIVSPAASDIIGSSQAKTLITTNEWANCTYSVDNSANISFAFTGFQTHESLTDVLTDGAHSIRFYCRDAAGNNATSSSVSFTISTSYTVDSVILRLSPKYYAGTYGNATVNVSSGGTVVKGLQPEDIIFRIDGQTQEIGLTERTGYYDLSFNVPAQEGLYPLSISASSTGGSIFPASVLPVVETKLYVSMDATGVESSQLVYRTSGNTTIGIGSDADADYINSSETSMGSSVIDNTFLFVSSTTNTFDKKTQLLEEKVFLDEALPAFSSNDDGVYTIGVTLGYEDVYVDGQLPELTPGNYRLIIINTGKVLSGEHKGKDRVRVYLEEVQP